MNRMKPKSFVESYEPYAYNAVDSKDTSCIRKIQFQYESDEGTPPTNHEETDVAFPRVPIHFSSGHSFRLTTQRFSKAFHPLLLLQGLTRACIRPHRNALNIRAFTLSILFVRIPHTKWREPDVVFIHDVYIILRYFRGNWRLTSREIDSCLYDTAGRKARNNISLVREHADSSVSLETRHYLAQAT